MTPKQASTAFITLLSVTIAGLPPSAQGQSPGLDEFVISDRSHYAPDLAADTGGFVVVWHEFSDQALRLFARRLSSTGEPVTGEIEVAAGHESPSLAVASDPEGSFVVVW